MHLFKWDFATKVKGSKHLLQVLKAIAFGLWSTLKFILPQGNEKLLPLCDGRTDLRENTALQTSVDNQIKITETTFLRGVCSIRESQVCTET